MLGGLRDDRHGGPSGRVRATALVIALALLGLTAPVVVPVAGRVWRAVTGAVPGL